MNNKPTFRSSKLLKSGENYETSLSLATPIHDVQVLGQREENQRFENGLGFMAKILAALFKVLPFKFWLVCGLCSTTIGFYLIYQLFSWKTLYAIVGLVMTYFGLSFAIKYHSTNTEADVVSTELKLRHEAEVLRNETQVKIAYIEAQSRQTELELARDTAKMEIDRDIHKVDKDSEIELCRINNDN